MVQAPIFHVNGDDPEACVRVAELAFEYRQRFHKDVVIDMVCYRRHGHNEGDDPSYTQPLMYKAIAERRSVRKLYVEALVKRGELTRGRGRGARSPTSSSKLQVALDETRAHAPEPVKAAKPPKPHGRAARTSRPASTRATLDAIFDHLTAYPDGFTPHPKLVRQFETRAKLYHEAGEVEWATAEALAHRLAGARGHAVRLAGEDSRRGTFSQRHAALDRLREREARGCRIATLPGKQASVLGLRQAAQRVRRARLRVRLLARRTTTRSCCGRPSSATSSTAPRSSSTSTSWPPRTSGARRTASCCCCRTASRARAPSTRSARIERFLTLCAEDNIQVCNATTAAQYFHLLRRQVRRDVRKPLVLFTPRRRCA